MLFKLQPRPSNDNKTMKMRFQALPKHVQQRIERLRAVQGTAAGNAVKTVPQKRTAQEGGGVFSDRPTKKQKQGVEPSILLEGLPPMLRLVVEGVRDVVSLSICEAKAKEDVLLLNEQIRREEAAREAEEEAKKQALAEIQQAENAKLQETSAKELAQKQLQEAAEAFLQEKAAKELALAQIQQASNALSQEKDAKEMALGQVQLASNALLQEKAAKEHALARGQQLESALLQETSAREHAEKQLQEAEQKVQLLSDVPEDMEVDDKTRQLQEQLQQAQDEIRARGEKLQAEADRAAILQSELEKAKSAVISLQQTPPVTPPDAQSRPFDAEMTEADQCVQQPDGETVEGDDAVSEDSGAESEAILDAKTPSRFGKKRQTRHAAVASRRSARISGKSAASVGAGISKPQRSRAAASSIRTGNQATTSLSSQLVHVAPANAIDAIENINAPSSEGDVTGGFGSGFEKMKHEAEAHAMQLAVLQQKQLKSNRKFVEKLLSIFPYLWNEDARSLLGVIQTTGSRDAAKEKLRELSDARFYYNSHNMHMATSDTTYALEAESKVQRNVLICDGTRECWLFCYEKHDGGLVGIDFHDEADFGEPGDIDLTLPWAGSSSTLSPAEKREHRQNHIVARMPEVHIEAARKCVRDTAVVNQLCDRLDRPSEDDPTFDKIRDLFGPRVDIVVEQLCKMPLFRMALQKYLEGAELIDRRWSFWPIKDTFCNLAVYEELLECKPEDVELSENPTTMKVALTVEGEAIQGSTGSLTQAPALGPAGGTTDDPFDDLLNNLINCRL